jgi:hypothetical protein
MWKANLGTFLGNYLLRKERLIQENYEEEVLRDYPELKIVHENIYSVLASRGRHALYNLRLPLNFDRVFDLNCVGQPIITSAEAHGLIDISGFWVLSRDGHQIMEIEEFLEHENLICNLGSDLTASLDDLGKVLSICRDVIQTSHPISGKEVILNIDRLTKVIEKCKSQTKRRAYKDLGKVSRIGKV